MFCRTLLHQSIDEFDYSDYDRRKLVDGEKVVVTTIPEKHPVIEGETTAAEAYDWIINRVGASLPEIGRAHV